MVLLGGLEIVAAGYLIHKHNKNKRERAILKEEAAALEEEAAALEEEQYPLQDPRPHRRHHSQSLDRKESREERHERHRRRRSRERREQEKWEAENAGWQARPGGDHSAPPKVNAVPVIQHVATFPAKTQKPQPGYPPTGWPAHWKQSQTPPTPPPQSQMNTNAYPQDVKYGFVPEIPHDQYPPYPPPPFSPSPGAARDARGRANTLDVNDGRGRRKRRSESVSPNLGVRDEYSRSPVPRVRFSNEDVVLGEERRRAVRSPPPSYRA